VNWVVEEIQNVRNPLFIVFVGKDF